LRIGLVELAFSGPAQGNGKGADGAVVIVAGVVRDATPTERMGAGGEGDGAAKSTIAKGA